jgi:CheY-like chemotaxis protein
MDLQMPLMDGFEASRRIREWENGNQRTYIVALTASYMPEEGQKLFEAGIDNYISKPFEVEHIHELLSIIARSEHFTPPAEHFKIEGFAANNGVLDVQRGLRQIGWDVKTWALCNCLVMQANLISNPMRVILINARTLSPI